MGVVYCVLAGRKVTKADGKQVSDCQVLELEESERDGTKLIEGLETIKGKLKKLLW